MHATCTIEHRYKLPKRGIIIKVVSYQGVMCAHFTLHRSPCYTLIVILIHLSSESAGRPTIYVACA